MERVTWKQTLPYGKPGASGNLLYDAGSSNLVLCGSLDGVGVGGGGSRSREHALPMADSC